MNNLSNTKMQNQSTSTRNVSPLFGFIAAAIALTASLSAQTPSNQQAGARPLGLEVAGPVNTAASDSKSYSFQTQDLPDILSIVNDKLGERAAIDDSLLQLDPTKLDLSHSADVRVYFVGEGAGYHNTLGINTTGTGVNQGDPELIFPDASSRNRYVDGPASDRQAGRNRSNPLAPGDFVDLGTIEGGSTLDFFLIANGAFGGSNVYTTDAAVNPDRINHTVALASDGSPYLVIGFEDLYGGGDRDFNDLVFAVDIGAANLAAITATPEPAMVMTLGLFGSAVALRIRGKRAAKNA